MLGIKLGVNLEVKLGVGSKTGSKNSVLAFLKYIDRSVLAFLKCTDGSVSLCHLCPAIGAANQVSQILGPGLVVMCRLGTG